MANLERQFAAILTELQGISTGYRVVDLRNEPLLTSPVYVSEEQAHASDITNKLVVCSEKPWRVWYIAATGPQLMQEFETAEEATKMMAITPLQLRLSGPALMGGWHC